MNIDRIKEIHKSTAYPDSISVYNALLQVWNECEQGKDKNKNDTSTDISSSLCEYGENPSNCIRRNDTCFKCNK